MSDWMDILKNKEGPQTKREVIQEQMDRAGMVTNLNRLYQNYYLHRKPKWFGALSSLNDLRNGYQIPARGNIDQTITGTEKIIFKLYIDGHIINDEIIEQRLPTQLPPGKTFIVNALLDIRANLINGKSVEITPVEPYKSINDFVEIYNKPGHKYKNIEAQIIYRPKVKRGSTFDIKLDLLTTFKYKQNGQIYLYYLSPSYRIAVNHHTLETFKYLKGIQIRGKDLRWSHV